MENLNKSIHVFVVLLFKMTIINVGNRKQFWCDKHLFKFLKICKLYIVEFLLLIQKNKSLGLVKFVTHILVYILLYRYYVFKRSKILYIEIVV